MARMSEYRAPRRDAPETEKVGWATDTLQAGQAFLQSQRAYSSIEEGREFIAGIDMEKLPDSYSRVDVNRGKRQIRENVATLSNVRPLWGYQTDDKSLEKQVYVRNQALKSWHYSTPFFLWLKEGLQYAGVEGTGYLRPYWDKDWWSYGRGEIICAVHDSRSVIPIQIGKDKDLQKAYAVVIHHEVPLAQAHAMYPTKQHLITADRDAPTGLRKVWGKVQRWLSPALNVAGMGKGQSSDVSIFPVVDMYEIFIRDLEINETDHQISMGEPLTSWHYTVPYVGQEIPAGIRNTAGQMLYRKALPEDCMIYPLRRRMMLTTAHCLEDDTAQDWHGKVPLIKLCTDEWAWEYLGFGMPRDYKPIQDSNRRLLRAIDDSMNARLDPSLAYDDQSIARDLMEEFDPRQPGQRIGVNMQMGETVKPVLPPEYYNVPQGIPEHIERMWGWADHLIGTPEYSALARLKQIPAGDSVDKLLEAAGPIITEMSLSIEQKLRDLGEMWKCMSFQRYNTPRLMQLAGKNAVSEENYYYDPQTGVPSHMPGEDPNAPSQYNYYQLARFYMQRMHMHVTPGSAHRVTQMAQRLFLTQLYTRDFPIDPWTLADAAEIPDFGSVPEGTSTVMERYVAWRNMRAAMLAREAKFVQEAAAAAMPPDGSGAPPGRPPSGLKSPTIQSKDGGTRSTIANS